jgi:hypothetical protein
MVATMAQLGPGLLGHVPVTTDNNVPPVQDQESRPDGPPSGHPERLLLGVQMDEVERILWDQLPTRLTQSTRRTSGPRGQHRP